jgi:hypothetical membrane protein
VGVVVYVVIDVALVFLRPQFSVLHNAESDYGSRGPYDWVMDANFVLRCLVTFAAIAAVVSVVADRATVRRGLRLLGVWAVASGLLAFLPDDPVGTKTHARGAAHLLFALIAFVAVIVGTFATLRGLRGDSRFAPVQRPLLGLALAAVVAIVLLGQAGLGVHSLGGLWEKTFLGCEMAWIALLAGWCAHLARPDAASVPTPVSVGAA